MSRPFKGIPFPKVSDPALRAYLLAVHETLESMKATTDDVGVQEVSSTEAVPEEMSTMDSRTLKAFPGTYTRLPSAAPNTILFARFPAGGGILSGGGNARLAGGDFVTSDPDEVIPIIFDGEVWREIGRKKSQHYLLTEGIEFNSGSTPGLEGTLLVAGLGSKVIPANTLRIGTTIRIDIRGTFLNVSSDNHWRTRLGGVLVGDTGNGGWAAGLSGGTWNLTSLITCLSVGPLGTVIEAGAVVFHSVNVTGSVRLESAALPVTVDTTADLEVDCTLAVNAIVGDFFTSSCGIIEVLGGTGGAGGGAPPLLAFSGGSWYLLQLGHMGW